MAHKRQVGSLSTTRCLMSCFCCLLMMSVLFLSGWITHLFSVPFYEFRYPLEVDMIQLYTAAQLRQPIDVDAVNPYHFVNIVHSRRCDQSDWFEYLLVVKSSVGNFRQRSAIRRTWGRRGGHENHETIFLLGKSNDHSVMYRVFDEALRYDDIVLDSFADSYRNNTYKAMMGLRWLAQNCLRRSKYVMFLDDDYLLNPANLHSYLRHSVAASDDSLFVGYCWAESRPKRSLLSKWHVSLKEYEFDNYPPYPNAGSYLMSMSLVHQFATVAEYVKYMPFDDVFMGIVAWKLSVAAKHDDRFSIYYLSPNNANFSALISSHGYSEEAQLLRAWKRIAAN